MRWKLLVAIGFLSILFAVSTSGFAHDYNRDDDGHPLRIIAYAGHAVGMVAEYAISRPIHWVVSQPVLKEIFGHEAHDYDEFFVWE